MNATLNFRPPLAHRLFFFFFSAAADRYRAPPVSATIDFWREGGLNSVAAVVVGCPTFVTGDDGWRGRVSWPAAAAASYLIGWGRQIQTFEMLALSISLNGFWWLSLRELHADNVYQHVSKMINLHIFGNPGLQWADPQQLGEEVKCMLLLLKQIWLYAWTEEGNSLVYLLLVAHNLTLLVIFYLFPKLYRCEIGSLSRVSCRLYIS